MVLLVVPMLQNVYYSFFNWDGLGAPVFNGIKNYVTLFTDAVIGTSMLNTVLWAGFSSRCSSRE